MSSAPETLARWQLPMLIVGGAGLVVTAIAAVIEPGETLPSWLVAFLFCWELAVGCLGLSLLSNLVRGRWSLMARPFLQAGVGTLPLIALAFVPVALFLPELFRWADPSEVAADPHLQHKAPYLNAGGFYIRAVIYFVAWVICGLFMMRGGPLARYPDRRSASWGRLASAWGLMLFVLTTTFAAFDWIMSLDPDWYSTMFGLLIGEGAILMALCVVTIGVSQIEPLPTIVGLTPRGLLNDLGNLLLAFVMIWAYLSISQYLIIWSGNLPFEAIWYLTRSNNGWQWPILAVILFHFAVPFLLLLSRDVKQNPRALCSVATLVMLMHLVHLWWLVEPVFEKESLSLHWSLPFAVAGLFGLWSFLFLWLAKGRLARTLDALAASPPEPEAHA